jgi:serine/threonine-protein kinase RsbW
MNTPVNSVTRQTGHQSMFTARMKDLGPVREFIDRFCRDEQIEHAAGLRLHLVAEELFTNTVKHGHKGGSDAPVVITLRSLVDVIEFRYEDQSPPFNPIAWAEKVKLAEQAASGKEGGLGTVLAKGMAVSGEYYYMFGHNQVRFRLPLKAPVAV